MLLFYFFWAISIAVTLLQGGYYFKQSQEELEGSLRKKAARIMLRWIGIGLAILAGILWFSLVASDRFPEAGFCASMIVVLLAYLIGYVIYSLDRTTRYILIG